MHILTDLQAAVPVQEMSLARKDFVLYVSQQRDDHATNKNAFLLNLLAAVSRTGRTMLTSFLRG